MRHSRGWSQGDLAIALCEVSGHPTLSREEIHRWETGKVIPGKFWLGHLSRALNMPLDALTAEAKLDRVNRRNFLSLSALTVAHGKLAAEMTASIGANDSGVLTSVQTTHGTDLVIASFVDRAGIRRLRRWMHAGETDILRVNAAGILAKTPGQDLAEEVADVLDDDPATRRLYTTAVLARAASIPWATAANLASGQAPTRKQAQLLASRLAHETLNPRDAGARWCSAAMLRDLSPLLGPGR